MLWGPLRRLGRDRFLMLLTELIFPCEAGDVDALVNGFRLRYDDTGASCRSLAPKRDREEHVQFNSDLEKKKLLEILALGGVRRVRGVPLIRLGLKPY